MVMWVILGSSCPLVRDVAPKGHYATSTTVTEGAKSYQEKGTLEAKWRMMRLAYFVVYLLNNFVALNKQQHCDSFG